MDSIKKKTAINGIKKVTALRRCLENLTDRMTSVIIQDRFRSGTHTNRNRRKVNPESIRLNPTRQCLRPGKCGKNGNLKSFFGYGWRNVRHLIDSLDLALIDLPDNENYDRDDRKTYRGRNLEIHIEIFLIYSAVSI